MTRLIAVLLLGAFGLSVASADDTDQPCGSAGKGLLVSLSCDNDDGRDDDNTTPPDRPANAEYHYQKTGFRLDLEEAIVAWTLSGHPDMEDGALLLVRGEKPSDNMIIARRGSKIEFSRGGEVLLSKIIDQHGGSLEAYVHHEGGMTRIGMWENGRHLFSDALPSNSNEFVAMGPVVSISR